MDTESDMSMIEGKNSRWQAPEITKGFTNYSGKVDVYSYGFVLYQLLTGRSKL
jgi:serine/threonine protein kinase